MVASAPVAVLGPAARVAPAADRDVRGLRPSVRSAHVVQCPSPPPLHLVGFGAAARRVGGRLSGLGCATPGELERLGLLVEDVFVHEWTRWVNEPGRPVPSRLHLVRLWEDREERLVALHCVLSCVRWHGQSENPADLLRLVRRCLVVFRVERFVFDETRNAVEVGLYTHWRWRFLMLRYWGVVRYNLWRETLPARLSGDSWVPSERELVQGQVDLEDWERRWEAETGREVDSDATSVARESQEWDSPLVL